MAMSGTLAEAVFDLIQSQGNLGENEVLVHFDLVAETRQVVDGIERMRRIHWTPEGADPHLSQSVLLVEAVKILLEIAGGNPA